MDLQLTGKKVIVTGGTKGIGRAIVETFGAEGCSVAFCARNAEQVTQTANILKASGILTYGGVVDIADGKGLKDWIVQASNSLGGLDILILSAGALAMGADETAWLKNLQIDILGAVNAIEAALPMLEQSAQKSGDAAIVAISSTAFINASEPSSYGAVKASLIHLIKGVARKNASKHIRANVVSPGMVYFTDGFWNKIEQQSPAFFQRSLERNPMGRMATPQDIANAVVFLASPRSSYTNGVNLIVDGVLSDRVNY